LNFETFLVTAVAVKSLKNDPLGIHPKKRMR